MSFGQHLRALRREYGISQRDLARLVTEQLDDSHGFDFTYLSKIENDRVPPPSNTVILAIAVVLDVDPDELMAAAIRVPVGFGQLLRTSEGARRFYRLAMELQPSEQEWAELTETARTKRAKLVPKT